MLGLSACIGSLQLILKVSDLSLSLRDIGNGHLKLWAGTGENSFLGLNSGLGICLLRAEHSKVIVALLLLGNVKRISIGLLLVEVITDVLQQVNDLLHRLASHKRELDHRQKGIAKRLLIYLSQDLHGLTMAEARGVSDYYDAKNSKQDSVHFILLIGVSKIH
jgi:hypothetical protein